MNRILVIMKKEMMDMLRDRRSLFFMLVFPLIIIPLIMSGIPKLTKSLAEKEMDKTITIAVIGEEYNTALVQFLSEQEKVNLSYNITENNIEAMINEDVIDGGLVFSKDMMKNMKDQLPAEIILYHRSSKGVNFVFKRISSILEIYSSSINEARYAEMNLNANSFKPFNVIEQDVASDKEKFGKTIGTFLPYLFLIFCFSGALYPALDMGAGEKERGTLETILTSPALRIEIMLGKFFVVAIFGIMSAIFGLIGLILAVRSNSDIPSEIIMKAADILDPGSIFMVMMLLIPISLFFSSFLLAVSFYAKSFKEAQSITGPMNFLIIIPLVIGTLPGIVLSPMTAWIPILNVSLAMNDIIAGIITIPLYFEVFISQLIFASLSIWFSIRFINKESVIFRD
tara:strand:+ start:757 stop:1950 length:1194 start_codon:yes stop_codon:yes gene_type:complete